LLASEEMAVLNHYVSSIRNNRSANEGRVPTKTPTLSQEFSAISKGAILFIARVTFDNNDILMEFNKGHVSFLGQYAICHLRKSHSDSFIISRILDRADAIANILSSIDKTAIWQRFEYQ
jgi:hypothetical protein